MKFIDDRRLLLRVGVVNGKKERTTGLSQQPHYLHIRRGEFGAAIHNHDDGRSFVEGNSRLPENLRRNEIFVFGNNSAGVDDADATTTPLRVAIEPVASNARFIAHDRTARTDDAVEQRGLAYIRPAHDGQRRNAGCGGGESAARVVSRLCHTWVGSMNRSKMRRVSVRWQQLFIIETPVALSSHPASSRTPSRSLAGHKDGSSAAHSTLYQFFAPGGVLAATHPAYEFRRGQLQMAQAVEQALEEKRHLIVEAGTGTGKTLAYLMPVIRSGKRVIISTGTKNLQEQLFYKDIPFLEHALYGDHVGTAASAVQPSRGPGRLSVCYMKGRNNYLCRKKLYDLSA